MNQEKESKNRNNIKYKKKKKKRVSNLIIYQHQVLSSWPTRNSAFQNSEGDKNNIGRKVKYKWKKFNYLDIKILVST